VEDLSGKGTVVSGARTSRASLPMGADIALGPWQAVLREPGAPPESSWSCRGLGTVRIHSPPALPGSGSRAPHLPPDFPPAGPPTTAQPIIGADPSIRQLAHFIEWVASSPALVAIFGEAGSGRELVARAIHARSFRAERPFVRVNCRARDTETLAAELFGAPGEPDTEGASGSGAFSEARGGTLFLDEVGELSLEVQARFLRRVALREARPDGGRVVVATSQDLLSHTRAGLFREDLYDRLCLAPIVLAPLRRRPGDVPALAEHFVRCFSPRGQPVRLTCEALTRLSRYWWPGNLRELQNVIRRALLLRHGPRIDVSDLRFDGAPSDKACPPHGSLSPA
jgi:DNA-binding NtrC family response regulator